jgi:hypothetical protein
VWLVGLTADETKETEVRLVASSSRLKATALKSSSIAGDEVRLVFDADGAPIDFQGRFQEGVVRGNVLSVRETLHAARMVPTEAKNLRQYDNPLPDPARDEWVAAAGQDEPFAPLSRFVRRRPASPLAIAAFHELIGLAQAEGLDRSKFEALAGEYLQSARRWGPRMELRATIDLGLILSRHEYLPDLALEYLNTADKAFDDNSPDGWKNAVGVERGKCLIAAGMTTEGVAVLNRIREAFPFEPTVIYSLAREAEKEGKTDDALALYGEIAALPLQELALLEALKVAGHKPARDEYPSRIVSRIWTEKHGDRQGLPGWLSQLYESRIRALAGERRPPRPKGGGSRVVVCELFTNGDCEPCVAADVSLAALESAYAPSEVVVLRYHQHKPGPDPLANEESAERFKQYNGSATPTLLVNGRRFAVGGGPLSDAPPMYRALRSLIDPMLEEKIDLRLELSAKADQGKVQISARAAGLKEFPANARLTIVLAEKKIDCALKNGIRLHEMVVRTLPTAPAGVTAVNGQLTYSGEVDLSKLKRRLLQHLATIERENFIEFEEKPVDLKSLELVVLLQNSETGEILQAAAVPVTGSESGVGTKSSGPPDSPKKPASGGN